MLKGKERSRLLPVERPMIRSVEGEAQPPAKVAVVALLFDAQMRLLARNSKDPSEVEARHGPVL